jgi:hypothetical protein
VAQLSVLGPFRKGALTDQLRFDPVGASELSAATLKGRFLDFKSIELLAASHLSPSPLGANLF